MCAHPEDRTPAGYCRACNREKYLRHRQSVLERSARRYALNREQLTAQHIEWQRKNRERMRAIDKAYRERHPGLSSFKDRKRRALERNAPGHSSVEQASQRMKFHGKRCVYCGGPFEHIDHAIPLSRGGSNWPANLVPSCASCNLSKGAKTWKEFLSCDQESTS